MTGICGWLGRVATASTTDELLGRMTAGLPTPVPGAGLSCAAEDAGLAVRGPAGGYALHREDRLWAAIEGSPRWRTTELAERARGDGHAAALAHAYRDHGPDLLLQLDGPFSFAILDCQARRALLAIDRFGVHRMCHAVGADQTLVFATTTGAIQAHPAGASTISTQSIFNYLHAYVCPSPGTIYGGQSKLLPAQLLDFRDGAAATWTYWHMPYRQTRRARRADQIAELRTHLRDAVGRAIDGEAPASVGAFLSGGLDSSTIVGVMGELDHDRPRTFTVGFAAEGYDETGFARTAARHFGAEHHIHMLTPADVLDFIPTVAQSYDEPFGNSSAIPAYYCARLAREHGIDRMLAGDGGDELFAGNTRYLRQLRLAAYQLLPAALRARVIEPVFDRPSLRRQRWLVGRIARYIEQTGLPMPDRMDRDNVYHAIDPREMFTSDVLAAIDVEAPSRMLRDTFAAAPSDQLLQKLMHLDLKIALADNDLRKVGRMCAVAGVDVRYPFLDEAVAEFSARLPPHLLANPFRIRRFYKQAMAGFLPQTIIRKPKQGFGMPFAEWLKHDTRLRELAHDALTSFKGRGYLKAAFIDRIVSAHGDAARSIFDGMVWDIMMLELWLRGRTTDSGTRQA